MTDDPSLLEEYILGRMAPADVRKWETHLQGCNECRKALAQELSLAAGVRRAGRDSLKASLQSALQQHGTTRSPVPWPRIMNLAAMLALLVGIVLVGRWIFLQTDRTVQPHETMAEQVPHAASPTKPDNASAPEKESNRDIVPPSAAQRGDELKSKGSPERHFAPAEPPQAPAAPSSSLAMKKAEVPPSQPSAAAGAMSAAPPVVSQQWSVAHVLSPDASTAGRAERGTSIAADAVRERDSQSDLVVNIHPGLPDKDAAVTQPGDQVPLTSTRDTHRTILTIYLPSSDSLVAREPWSVVRVSPDSILVKTSSRLFGIRLPESGTK